MARYLVVVGAVFAINLLPAFGPPTWAVLVLFRLNWGLNPVALVVLGAMSAGAGRYLLAIATRRLRGRLPHRYVASLRAAGQYLSSHRGRTVAGLALFAVSPLPSAQLFEAAGLLEVPLAPLTGAFFAGRIVSYSFYVGAAHLADRHFGSILRSALTSPLGIAVEVALILAVVLVARIDWTKHLPPSTA